MNNKANYNILFLIGTYPNYGGAEKVTTVLANEFRRRGNNVSIASFEQPHPELQNAELDFSIELIALSYPVLNKKNFAVLNKLIRDKQIDFIINQWCLPFYVTKLCLRVTKDTQCKILAVHHNTPNKNARIVGLQDVLKDQNQNNFKKFLYFRPKLLLTKIIIKLSMRYVYRKSDRYIVLSDSFIKVFSDFTCIKNANKLEVITNPLTINDLGKEFKKENIIIYVGRIDYNQKRVHRIIEFWEEAYKNLPNWKLEIVGDGPEREKLEHYVKNKDIKNIFFEGFQNPISYYQKAKLLLLTSDYEGFPLVIVEAISYGVIPIIYGSYPAIYDIIDNNYDGIILPVPYVQKDVLIQIQNLSKDGEALTMMAKNAKIKSKKFSLEKIMMDWEKLLFKLKYGSHKL